MQTFDDLAIRGDSKLIFNYPGSTTVLDDDGSSFKIINKGVTQLAIDSSGVTISNATIDTLNYDGNLDITDLNASGTIVGEVLNTTSEAIVGGYLTVGSTASFNDGVAFANGIGIITGGLEVITGGAIISGDATFTDDVGITGALSVTGGLSVTGSSRFYSPITVDDSLNVNAPAIFLDGVALAFGNMSLLSSDIDILDGNISITGDITVTEGDVGVSGDIIINTNSDANNVFVPPSLTDAQIVSFGATAPVGSIVFDSSASTLRLHNGTTFLTVIPT